MQYEIAMNNYGDTFTAETLEATAPEVLDNPVILVAGDSPAAPEADAPETAATQPRPCTEAQILASRNNFRHGMLAKAIIMKGESLDVVCDFIRSLEEAFQPQGAVENVLIEKMAISQWRQMRLMSLERSGIHFKIAQHEQAQPGADHSSASGLIPLDPSTTAFLAVADLTGNTNAPVPTSYTSRKAWGKGKF